MFRYIQRDEFLGAEGRQRFHFFNSFFYKKLSEVVNSQVYFSFAESGCCFSNFLIAVCTIFKNCSTLLYFNFNCS